MKTSLKILVLAALFALGSEGGYADPVGPLTTFTAGTPAKAAEVNGNFSSVSTAVNNNYTRITTLESTVTPAGDIVLAPSTASAGNILKGIIPFIHNFGEDNTFIGVNAGNFTMTGAINTASGARALQNNTTGSNNTASGVQALQSNTTGFNNTASGLAALLSNTTGGNNTASGLGALFGNTTGSANIAVGINAGANLTTGSNNIHIGNAGAAAESNTIRIGTTVTQTSTFIAGIRGVTTAGAAIPVLVDTNGQLGTASSSRRVKDDIAAMGGASGVLMKLRPVTFHYKTDRNPKGRTLQYGLVAEEVAEVAPGLVAHSADGRIETVYYQFLAPMLLNEYQRQQRTIRAQTARIAALEKQSMEIAELKQQATRMAGLLVRLEQAGMIATAGR